MTAPSVMALNPIAYTEKVVDGFLRYQLTSHPFADRRLYEQLRALLSLEQTRRSPLLRGPYFKLSPAFRRGAAIADLVADGVLHPHLAQLVEHPHVYGHQEKAIRAIAARRSTLVSTGTGSGKTECFLYPIISRCLRLRDEGAPPGIAAVLVYPMNALAEDQLDRLRDLLAGTGVSFGMYVGKTPEKVADVAGERLPPGTSREAYRRARDRARDERRETAVHPPEERVAREDMRTPGMQPRILLTNVKQLELLLTRQTDVELFDGAPLEFLVCDEAHTFTGAMGAETATLIRRLRAFCGRGADDTVCVGTSATIVDPVRGAEAGLDFAARFFGVRRDHVELVGEEYEPDVWASARAVPPPPADAREALRAALVAVDGDVAGAGGAVAGALAALSGQQLANSGPGWELALHEALASNEVVYQLATILVRPKGLGDLLTELRDVVGREVVEEEVLAWLTLGAAARREGRPLLRPVVHAFIRGIGGAAVTFPADRASPLLHLSRDAIPGTDALAALTVLSCTTCGQHYFEHHVADFTFEAELPGGGQLAAAGDGRYWKPTPAALDGKRVVLFDQLLGELDGSDDDEEDVAEDRGGRATKGTAIRCAEINFCRHCGTLQEAGARECLGCGRPGALAKLFAVRERERAEGKLARCLSCGKTGRPWGGSFREPAKPVRAVQVADVHVLAQEMLQHAERPRLLVFADSRQDAAFQAGWMRDHARRFRLRAFMWERLRRGTVSVGDLVADLDDRFEQDDALSRALLPEVWGEARKEAEGHRHQQERRYFLRVLVLREIATGPKERQGLEPWGRLRIVYGGLGADAAFIQQWAPVLGLTPDALLDGVATLLDSLRRRMLVHDRVHEVFGKWWDDGAREILAGYFPKFVGLPKGVKLQRSGSDAAGRVMQLLSARGDSIAKQAARAWGVKAEEVDRFVTELWDLLTRDTHLLVPVTLKGARGNALPNAAGVHQLDADRVRLEPHSGLWRCAVCRRAYARPTPKSACPAWRCKGTLRAEQESPEDYDLRLIDEDFRLVRPREHSAQVPTADREAVERAFKGESETVNTLVCTPTLELGVDIGALDAVLMRNVPPRAANYWQRAGRAGRRHRMAVNLTYARAVSHDLAYFAEPLKLLEGRVDPPRFNLRNDLLVAKHVHATVLTRLHQRARSPELSEHDREELATALKRMFPAKVCDWLFDERGEVRHAPFDVAPLRTVITKHRADLLATLERVFEQGWPAVDREVVEGAKLEGALDRMVERLDELIRRLRARLEWNLRQMARLDAVRASKGTLEGEDDEPLYKRCEREVKRMKGVFRRNRRDAEGFDDSNTMAVLAGRGFLPGYGLDVGSVTGTAEGRFEYREFLLSLPRPPSTALREFAPGTLLYANGEQYAPRSFHLEAEEQTRWLRVDPETQAVTEETSAPRPGVDQGPAGIGSRVLRAVRVCDVDLIHSSRITDDAEYRFQPSMKIYGHELGQHEGGSAYQWGARDLLLRKGVRFRLANVGAVLDHSGEHGFPVCLRCGQSRSPFASGTELKKFTDWHQERCGQSFPGRTAFYADVVADALSMPCGSRDEAYSILEAIRFGASRVLDMEMEDLQILVIGRPGSEQVDALLYDPMPGGSGLLQQVCARFGEVIAQALAVAQGCQSGCARSCIGCLQTFRNAFFHRHLDRNVVVERIAVWGQALEAAHEIPPRLPASAPTAGQQPVNEAERRLAALMDRAGLPAPIAQHRIALTGAWASTTPDFFFAGQDPDDPGVCLYLDGLSEAIHGNAQAQQRDAQISALLQSRGYHVHRIPATHLDDRQAMARHFFLIARDLGQRERGRQIRDDATWFDAAPYPAVGEQPEPLRQVAEPTAARGDANDQ